MIDGFNIIRTLKDYNDSVSAVYEVQDQSNGKHYVMKMIKGISTPLFKVIFEREVGALNKLRTCENIVRLEHFDTCNDNGECGRIFLEYIVGKNLQQCDVSELGNHSKFKIIQRLINAVQSAHENSIIHRDINPKNIMITEDENIKLIDFGISKIKDMVNYDTLYQFATNRYAAPEVLNHNENATEQSDIYSLGAVIYYLFTGEEPPIADEFEEELLNKGGIDVELKDILKIMIKKNLKERYNNIFEVKKDMLKLIKRFSKSNRTFIFTVNSSLIGHMKNMSLIPKYIQGNSFLNESLYEEFLEGYLFIEHEETEKEVYYLYGNHYFFECTFDQAKEVFQVERVKKLQPHIREEWKRKALIVNGDIMFIFSSMNVPSNNNFELTITVKDHKKEYLSSINVNNEYTKKYSSWHKLLEIMENECKKTALKIHYISYNFEDEYYIFQINEDDYYKIEDRKEELSFIFEDQTKNNKLVKIGDFSKAYIEKNKFVLRVLPNRRGKKAKIPQTGYIYEDYRKNLTLVHREKKALLSFNYEDYVSSSNLKSIFSGIQRASHFNTPQHMEFFNKKLDHTQRKAVEKALNSRDISLIQGPPGTGKTNVIIEIIRQILKVNQQGNIFKQKILLVSQSHAAVDKMLEDLEESSNDNSKVIRIGRDENLTEIVKEKFAVEHAQVRWMNNVIMNSNNYVKRIMESLQVKYEEFDEYFQMLLEIEINKNNENDSLSYKRENIVKNFEVKYKKQIKSKEFQWSLIQKNWVLRVFGRGDIQRHFIKNSVVISGTCTGVVSNYEIDNIVFDYLIIDEAAKATFPELLISIIRARKTILVGDHKQLPPVLDDNLIEKFQQEFSRSSLDSSTLYDSIFMKLNEYLPQENRQLLNTQYRMHPTIGTMISEVFYENAISNGVEKKDRSHPLKNYIDKAIVWIDTSNCDERYEEKNSTSYSNLFEANIVKEQLKIIDDGILETSFDVGIITPYTAQRNLILKEIEPINYKNLNEKVAVNTVDAFQGSQKDVIIYSTVRSNKTGRIGHLKSKERLNVAFSRAKRLLIIVGDSDVLNNISIEGNQFPKIIKYIKENKSDCEIVDYALKSNKRKE